MTTINSSLAKADDGTELVARSNLQQLSGVRKHLTRAEFDVAVAAERTRITNNAVGLYKTGEEFTIIGETGIRTWVLGTGGTDAANAAASHAKTVTIWPGLSFVLAADTNVVLFGTVVPAAGTGSDGDRFIDWVARKTYLKSTGAWSPSTGLGLTDAEVSAIQGSVGGSVVPGAWRGFPSVTMRLQMGGTGTVSMDSATNADGTGTLKTAVFTASPTGTQITKYAYPGDNARAIRITLTGTATCEVI